MSKYKEQFSQYTDEHLLSMRAMGEELAEDAHLAIEEIFAERGAALPPRPASPILQEDPTITKTRAFFRPTVFLIIFFLAVAATKVLAHTWIGIAIAIGVAVYWLYEKSLTPTDGQKTRDARKKADSESFNELMLKSAEGDLTRVVDLINYGADLNQQSASGYSALMLALRNNNLEIVKVLLDAGARVSLQTVKGMTTLDVAKKFCSDETVQLISKLLTPSSEPRTPA